jgi:teichuronic acid biosynthesis glycosyltransferase TuaC
MRVLVFTNMYPTERYPFYGSFVRDEAEALRAQGCEVDVYFVNGRASRLNYLGMPLGFARRLAAKPYDVVHVHHSYCGLVATMPRRVPVVWTFHEGEIMHERDMARHDDPMKRVAYSGRFKRHVAGRVDRVIVVAEFLKGPLGRDDAVTLAAGIDLERFAPMQEAGARRELGLDPDKRYVLFPSSPERIEKRYHLARDGVSALRSSLGGAGEDIELICLDRIPHERVPLYINAADVMLMTSAFEASPVTIREALCCNVPVLCTDVGDAREVLDGVDGCGIVPPDPGEIAVALERALSPPRRVDARGRMQRYSLESTARSVIGVYEDVLGRPPGGGS